ncbi:ATP-binding protein [Desulfolithobacter sp.]
MSKENSIDTRTRILLQNNKKVAEAASRMKSEFIANMNHEIRTPMNAILGYAEMLAAADLPEREQRYVSAILKSGATLVSMLNDIIMLSKIDSGSLEITRTPTHLGALLEEIKDFYQGRIREKKIELSCRIVDNLPPVFLLDGVHLKHILLNLVSNAIAFTPEGQVTILVEGVPAKNSDQCWDILLSVSDSGVGIPPEEQQRILELFQPDRNGTGHKYVGAGFGLTLSGRLAALMGGQISLVSSPGQGSIFTLRLSGVEPVVDYAKEYSSVHEEEARTPLALNQKLLVVDDMAMITDVIKDVYLDSAVEVLVANSADQGLAMAREQRPGLILLDLDLAGVDGRDIAQQLREDPETADIPIVLMSGISLDMTRYRDLFADQLTKPFSIDGLEKLVATYMNMMSPPSNPSGTGPEEVPDQSEQAEVIQVWDRTLDDMLEQVQASGNLCAAEKLGRMMQQRDLDRDGFGTLRSLGRQLIESAREPDIIAVDQIIMKLKQYTSQWKP